MQTLFIGFVEDAVDPIAKGIAIRIAYLFSAQIRISGNVPSYFTMEQSLRSMSFEQKIKFIDDREKNQQEGVQFSQHYKDFKKIYKKDRGHTKELIVLQKQTEKTVNEIFNRLIDDSMKIVEVAGLLNLKQITGSSSYGEYYVSYQHAEIDEEDLSKLSDVLLLNLDETDNNNPTIFVLTDLFFSPEFNWGDALMPELNAFSDKGFLQEIGTFFNYNYFSVTDLNTIRFEVNESLQHFQQAVHAFTALQANPVEAFTYLHTHVVALAGTLLNNINGTGLVVNNNKLMRQSVAIGKVYLGMVPRFIVFKYFEFIQASKEETIAILQQLPDGETQQLVPVLITRRFNGLTEPEETAGIAKAEPMPLKKSLSID